MKQILIIAFLATFIFSCTTPNDKFYSVAQTTYLLISPSETSKKLIDENTSSITKKDEYCSLDNSTKIIVLETEGNFSKVKVIEPKWQTDTYIGWIPTENLVEFGSAGDKMAVAPQKVNVRYEVISEEKSESSYKAQLKEYAFYKDTIYTKEALTSTITEIYNINKDKDVFESHKSATVIAIYLFTSKDAIKDKANWIAMLIKSPNYNDPRISFNEFKVTALNKINNNSKSKDEIELDKLNLYLKERGLELCALSDLLKKNELDNIHKADAKYPDYGDKHSAMIDDLDAQFYKALKKKYKLNEDMLSKVSVFAMAYCK